MPLFTARETERLYACFLDHAETKGLISSGFGLSTAIFLQLFDPKRV